MLAATGEAPLHGRDRARPLTAINSGVARVERSIVTAIRSSPRARRSATRGTTRLAAAQSAAHLRRSPATFTAPAPRGSTSTCSTNPCSIGGFRTGTPIQVHPGDEIIPWDGDDDRAQSGLGIGFHPVCQNPEWAGGTSVAVNGKSRDGRGEQGEYFAIKRNWQAGDKVR
jgi:hypothetical protein